MNSKNRDQKYDPGLVTASLTDLIEITGHPPGTLATITRCEFRDSVNLASLYYLIISADEEMIAATRNTIMEVGDWAENAPDDIIIAASERMRSNFLPILDVAERILQPKRSRGELASDLSKLVSSGGLSLSRGIEHGWLQDRFGCKPFAPPYFPYHGIIGIEGHSGLFVVQEMLLLDDAVYSYAEGTKYVELLKRMAESAAPRCDRWEASSRSLNQRACYSFRNLVVLLHSFFECFVNSVSLDHIYRSRNLPERDIAYLKGKRKGRYLSIENRLEGIPGLIRGDRRQHLAVRPDQTKDDHFRYFLGTVRDIRDSSMHNAAWKESIWRGPFEWKTLADKAFASAMHCSRKFWKACHPAREYPIYLEKLDKALLIEKSEDLSKSVKSAHEFAESI